MQRFPGRPIADYLRRQLPELAEMEEAERTAIPNTAPALWAKDKLPDDTPPIFIQRHYSNCLGHGLTRPDIRHLDPQLGVAIDNWLQTNDFPKGFDLPTLKQRNDRWADQINRGQGNIVVRNAADAFNLAGAIQRLKQGNPSK